MSTEFERRIASVEAGAAEFLGAQRWYAGKGAGVSRACVVDAAPLRADGGAFLIELQGEASRAGERYFVPLASAPASALEQLPPQAVFPQAPSPDGTRAIDASRDETALRELMSWIAGVRAVPAVRGGAFVGEKTPALDDVAADVRGPARAMNVEQSNTSIRVGSGIMLKLYRHVHAGPQPELEIARFLSAAGFANTPALLGSIEYRANGESTACAIAQRFVPSDGDAWEATLERLVIALGGGDAGAYGALLTRARRIGERTAELHRAFATPLGDPAFEPEPVATGDLASWTERARASAAAAFDTLEKRVNDLEPLTRARARALLERRAQVEGRLVLQEPPADLGVKTRYHGDYHLGQLLATGDDVLIVDFEGEPARPLEARRAKASPLRDVAGMLRSFDYVASAAERALAAELPASASSSRVELAQRARAWRDHASSEFLSAYRGATGGDTKVSPALLDLFIVEKACYELSYELANRPLWVDIPLGGLERLLEETPAARGASR